ncbi:hypothetical protein [Modestobacter sp. SSW1-42]|uniref:hypothetical protein n=1 Tax=Modestobacter sp. SSW1-42 TaxID=596372 RepID=UPI0039872BD7
MADDFTLVFRGAGEPSQDPASMVKQPIIFGDEHVADFYFVRGPRLAAVGFPDPGRYLHPETVTDPSSIRIFIDSARDILCVEFVAGAGSADGPTANRDAVNIELPNGSTLRANILTGADDLVVGFLVYSASEMTGLGVNDYPAFLN